MARYIAADHILKTILKWHKDNFTKTNKSYANGYKSAIEAVQDLIEDEASEDVKEVVRGEWVQSPDYDDVYNPEVICTACNCSCDSGFQNFCPNCGADMRKR